MRFPKLVIVIVAVASCKKPQEQPAIQNIQQYLMRVTAKPGLKIRETPDQVGRVISLIEFGKSVWVMKEYTQKTEIDGIAGQWVYVQATYGRDAKGRRVPDKEGWVFSGYLSKRQQVIPKSFSNFKAGCIGVGCDACGAVIFDPDGLFKWIYDCHSSPKYGQWIVNDADILVCIDLKCDPAKADHKNLIFKINESGKIVENTNQIQFSEADELLYWEPATGYDANRNLSLTPPE